MTQPFVSISNAQIYDKLVAVEAQVVQLTPLAQMVALDHERLRSVELELAVLRGGSKSQAKTKALMYTVGVGVLGALATSITPLVVK